MLVWLIISLASCPNLLLHIGEQNQLDWTLFIQHSSIRLIKYVDSLNPDANSSSLILVYLSTCQIIKIHLLKSCSAAA